MPEKTQQKSPHQSPGGEQKQPVVWRRRVIAIVVVVLAASIVGRVMLDHEEPTGSDPSAPGGVATGFAPAGGEQEVERPETFGDKMAKLLPYVTEAATALLLGMIVGIGTRMAIKTIVVVLILGTVAMQYAVFRGWMAPESTDFLGHLRDYVFHMPKGEDGTAALMDKAPSLGAGLLGFMMGLKRG